MTEQDLTKKILQNAKQEANHLIVAAEQRATEQLNEARTQAEKRRTTALAQGQTNLAYRKTQQERAHEVEKIQGL